MASTNSEVLERLLIEVVGDDSKLKAALDASVKSAQEAAVKMRDALALDLDKVTQDAKKASTAFDGMSAGVGDLGKILETQLKVGERAFERIRKAGEKSDAEFEEYRRTILDTIEVARPFARQIGVSSDALDGLAKRVREATYEQKQQEDQTERAQREQEELADTIKRLSNEVRGSRNVWAGRITTDEEFRDSTSKTRGELLKLLDTVERGSDEYRKITQELAYAQRGLDSVNKVASRGGLAWTAQIALANQFGQSLRGLGPAGGAAADALGFLSGAFGSLTGPMNAAEMTVGKLALSFGRFALVIAPMALALGAIVGAAGLGALTLSAAKSARELENATHRTGLTVEGLQELQHAARSVGVDMEVLNTTMQRLQRRAADANAGNEGLKRSFEQLGVTLTDNEGRMRTTEDLLGQVADGLNRIPDSADRIALAFKVFDTEGGRLLPLLAEGSEGIRRLREEARELGLVVSGDTVLSLSEFQAQVETVKRQFEVLKIEIGAAFLPLMRDLVIPLLQEQVIPWLQQAAAWVDEFSDAFFDTSEAGEAFRADTLKSLSAVIMLGQGIVATGLAAVGLAQILLGLPAGAIGAGRELGFRLENEEAILAARQAIIDSIREQERQLAALRAGELPPGFDPARVDEAIARTEESLDAARQRLEEFDAEYARSLAGILAQGFTRGAENIVGGGMESLGAALDVLAADIPAAIAAWASGVAPRVNRSARTVGENIGAGLGDGIGDGTREALEGSLRFAQEQLSKAQEELGFAVGQEARAAALLVVRAWEEAVALIQAELAAFDPAKAAKVWTQRLAAEVRFGLKDASEAFDLVNPRLEELREEAASALSEFGFDSTQYQDTLAKLEVLEALVKSIGGEAAGIDLSGLTRSVGTGFALPEGGDPTAGLVAGLQLIMRIEQTEAQLEGRALNIGEAFEWMLPILEDQMDEVERGSDLWFTIAALINQIRGDVDAMDTSALATLGGLSLPDSTKSVGQALVEGFQQIIRTEEALAGIRGQAADLSDEYEWMVEILDAHAATLEVGSEEWLQVVEAANRYRALITDLPDFALGGSAFQPEQTKTATDALRENHEWLLRVVAANDVLAGTQTDLTGTYSMLIEEQRLLIGSLEEGSEEWLQAVETLARYQEGLAGALGSQEAAGESFTAWAQVVGRLGVELDPVATAAAELGQLMADGEITAEQYAIGLNLVADAMDRLEEIEAAAAVEQATQAWETARDQLDSLLGQGPSKFDELREAAQAAFDAGIIGADDLRKALEAIDVLEFADGFRQVAAELSGAASILPSFAADMTEAFAMFQAGNRTGAITSVFQAATAAVRGLGDAFEDEARRGEAFFDLLIGGAATLATVLGGPALGQAVAAAGEFIKSILGDLTNGLAQIERQISQAASGSRFLGENLIRGLAESTTRQVSRGGLLGLLGFTKSELDEDAFRAGISIAEGLASGLVGTLRSGDFEEAWDAFIDDVIVNGIIEAFIATALVQDALQQAMELIMAGDAAGGAATLDRLKEDFRRIWETIQGITTTDMPSQEDLERSVMFSLPDATVSVLAAPQWALELSKAATTISAAGAALQGAAESIEDTFAQPIRVEFEPSPRGIDAARSL